MKIEGLRSEKNKDRVRIAATIIWESADRPKFDLYFETDDVFADDLSLNPHAFLAGVIIPAMHYGEERIYMDAEICPAFKKGLTTIMNWLRLWYDEPERKLVRLETKIRNGRYNVKSAQRAGFLFSGGVDSLATLYKNRLDFPKDHPWSIKDGLTVYGLEMDSPKAFEYVLDALKPIAIEAGIVHIPVYTNVYLMYRKEDARQKFKFWTHKLQAAALAAIAHAFQKRLDTVFIAADASISTLALRKIYCPEPWGTHPLLDYNYSSSNLAIRHDGLTLTRLEKIKLIAGCKTALKHLRVCNRYKKYQSSALNCGICDKCLRTMVALLAIGKLDQAEAFEKNDISAKFFQSIFKPNQTSYHFYQELIQALLEVGRTDLVNLICQGEHTLKKDRRKRQIKSVISKFMPQMRQSGLEKTNSVALPVKDF